MNWVGLGGPLTHLEMLGMTTQSLEMAGQDCGPVFPHGPWARGRLGSSLLAAFSSSLFSPCNPGLGGRVGGWVRTLGNGVLLLCRGAFWAGPFAWWWPPGEGFSRARVLAGVVL